ncbi:hypothetical protein ACHAWF_004219 [Thalassiosira exigua]
MAINSLAVLAVGTLAAAEVACPSSLRASAALVTASVVLLFAAADFHYALAGIVLASFAAGGCYAIHNRRHLPADMTSGERSPVGKLTDGARGALPSACASLFHAVGLWMLPWLILWRVTDSYTEPRFWSHEAGHLIPATLLIVITNILPVIAFPTGYAKPTLEYQKVESISITFLGFINTVIFRTAHQLSGHGLTNLASVDWDHELLGLVFFGSAVVGLLYAMQGTKTSVQIVFPMMYVGYTLLLGHNNKGHMSDDMKMWVKVWMKLHGLAGSLFLIGAFFRLAGRVIESMLVFFVGNVVIATSAKYLTRSMCEPFDHQSEDGKEYPTDRVVPVLIITTATVFYSLFLGGALRLRKVLDKDAISCSRTSDGAVAFEVAPKTLNNEKEELLSC